MEISNSPLGLVLVLVLFLTGFAFTFSFWRDDRLSATKSMKLEVPIEDALALSVEAMERSHIRGIRADPDGRTVSGHTGLSFRSLGTHCSIGIRPTDGGSLLACTCWPRAEFVLTDWGARHMILEALVSEIESRYEHRITPLDPSYGRGPVHLRLGSVCGGRSDREHCGPPGRG